MKQIVEGKVFTVTEKEDASLRQTYKVSLITGNREALTKLTTQTVMRSLISDDSSEPLFLSQAVEECVCSCRLSMHNCLWWISGGHQLPFARFQIIYPPISNEGRAVSCEFGSAIDSNSLLQRISAGELTGFFMELVNSLYKHIYTGFAALSWERGLFTLRRTHLGTAHHNCSPQNFQI